MLIRCLIPLLRHAAAVICYAFMLPLDATRHAATRRHAAPSATLRRCRFSRHALPRLPALLPLRRAATRGHGMPPLEDMPPPCRRYARHALLMAVMIPMALPYDSFEHALLFNVAPSYHGFFSPA